MPCYETEGEGDGAAVRRARQAARITLVQLAAFARVHLPDLSRWERGVERFAFDREEVIRLYQGVAAIPKMTHEEIVRMVVAWREERPPRRRGRRRRK